jgi:hypothetical protein
MRSALSRAVGPRGGSRTAAASIQRLRWVDADQVRRSFVRVMDRLAVVDDHGVRGVLDELAVSRAGLGHGFLRAAADEGVLDAVRQHRVLVGPDALLEVVGDARRDGLAGDLLAPAGRKEDEG